MISGVKNKKNNIMNWKTEKRKLKDLVPYEKNPRILTDKQKKEIEKSLKKFNLVEIPAINLDNKIIAGHQRVKILYDLNGPEYEIDVRVPDKLLNEKDYKEYLLRSNKNKADWDLYELFNFNTYDKDLLLDVGFDIPDFGNDHLVDKVNNSTDNADWVGLPDFEAKEKMLKIIIQFDTLEEMEQFSTENQMEFTKKTQYVWSTRFPFKKNKKEDE